MLTRTGGRAAREAERPTADRFGLGLAELAAKVWTDGERDPKRHGVLGQALAELQQRRLVLSTGGRRARYAVSDEGEMWLRRYRVEAARPAAPVPAAVSAMVDPIEAAIEAFLGDGPPDPLAPSYAP